MRAPDDTEAAFEARRDARHASVVARFPGGLTRAQFEMLTLESADEDGRLDPPSIADPWASMSILIGMAIRGLIDGGPQRNRWTPWHITAAGRAAISAATGEKG